MDLVFPSKTFPDVGLAKSVHESWKAGLFLDFTIQVEDEEFKVHKLIMASVSDYFKAMLTGGMLESQTDTVRLHGFSSLVFSDVIDYIYTNQIPKPRAKVEELLACAMYFQIPSLIEAATDMLKDIVSLDNCFNLAWTFEAYGLENAVQHTRKFIKSSLDKIQENHKISELPFEHFQIFCEIWERSDWDLCVIINEWVMTDYENRRKTLKCLMGLVQLNIMTPTQVKSVRALDIYSDESWHEFIDTVEVYHNLPIHQKMMQTFRVRGNPSPICFYTDEMKRFSVLQEDYNWGKEVESPAIPVFSNGIAKCVEFKNFLLVCDSYSSNQEWYVFDGWTFEWSTMAKMVTPKADFALVHDGKESVYALGGRVNVGTDTESVTDMIEKYDIRTDTWSVLDSTLPIPLHRHCACLCFDSIYVAGGWNSNDTSRPYSRRLDCLDLSTKTWQMKKLMAPTDAFTAPCHVMHLMEFNNETVIVTLDEGLRLRFYNPKTNHWTCIAYTTSFFNVFEYHPHSKVLACPRENAFYLLNFDRSIEPDDEEEEEYMTLGGCIKLSLLRHKEDVEEEELQGFPLMVGPIWGDDLNKNPFISGVLSVPPLSLNSLISQDEGAMTMVTKE